MLGVARVATINAPAGVAQGGVGQDEIKKEIQRQADEKRKVVSERCKDGAHNKDEAAEILIEIFLKIKSLPPAHRAARDHRLPCRRRGLGWKGLMAPGTDWYWAPRLEAQAGVTAGAKSVDGGHGGEILAESASRMRFGRRDR